jgi:hypothetical protein
MRARQTAPRCLRRNRPLPLCPAFHVGALPLQLLAEGAIQRSLPPLEGRPHCLARIWGQNENCRIRKPLYGGRRLAI